ncbi:MULTISPECIES: competence protein ComK [Brochothrix]|uniref:Competence protein n=2 Tax=Bacteria TaxID=2 RepID=A0A1D2L6Y0_BROTH|nr:MULTISPECIES: competence protein ComK [Brochothrix]ANZ95655.1 hypothetical protein BFC19_09830 [Brochothrix thermosphacta]ANZ98301.1 hypothetical protein BFC20_11605 [Brochothrix thermosphacta]ATF25500.1 competence protein [Brochothrix thermosphacta]ATH84833.1 competence protein [Brochothrix thermosphacta]MBR5526620.1 competence protein ComK [Brochothrix sp.]
MTLILNDYEINASTMLIKPLIISKYDCHSIVLDSEGSQEIALNPVKLISDGCKFFGSSLEGRKTATKHLIGFTHKAPIMIDSLSYIFTFPTTSPKRKNDCIWVFPQHLSRYHKAPHSRTHLIFHNGFEITLDISFDSFSNQLARTSLLHMKLLGNFDKAKRKNLYLTGNTPPSLRAAESTPHYNYDQNNNIPMNHSLLNRTRDDTFTDDTPKL